MEPQAQLTTSKLADERFYAQGQQMKTSGFVPSEIESSAAAYIAGCLAFVGAIPNPIGNVEAAQNMETTMRIIARCLHDLQLCPRGSNFPSLPFEW